MLNYWYICLPQIASYKDNLIELICIHIIERVYVQKSHTPASILHKSIAGRYRPVSYHDGPIKARYRFMKNAYWVTDYLYLSRVVRKCTLDLCSQLRLKSACAFPMSDQGIRWPQEDVLHPLLAEMRPVKILIRLRECAG